MLRSLYSAGDRWQGCKEHWPRGWPCCHPSLPAPFCTALVAARAMGRQQPLPKPSPASLACHTSSRSSQQSLGSHGAADSPRALSAGAPAVGIPPLKVRDRNGSTCRPVGCRTAGACEHHVILLMSRSQGCPWRRDTWVLQIGLSQCPQPPWWAHGNAGDDNMGPLRTQQSAGLGYWKHISTEHLLSCSWLGCSSIEEDPWVGKQTLQTWA